LMDALGHRCAVIGGVAVIAHGFPRSTADIDVAVAAAPADVEALLRCAQRLGFAARTEGAAAFARQNLVLLLVHTATGVPVDLSLALQGFEHRAVEQAVVRKVGAASLRVTPLTALLIYKMVAARPKDVDDVRALLATGAPYDAGELAQTLEEFDALLETDRAGEFRRLRSLP
jgi:hypothetical protein